MSPYAIQMYTAVQAYIAMTDIIVVKVVEVIITYIVTGVYTSHTASS